jgi:hypothetical protein
MMILHIHRLSQLKLRHSAHGLLKHVGRLHVKAKQEIMLCRQLMRVHSGCLAP